MNKIHNAPSHPTADAFRKTVDAVRNSPAGVDPLVDAAALALDLFAVLLDAGAFGLALDFPADTDDRLGRLQAVLDVTAAKVPDAAAADRRQFLIDTMHTAARGVLDASPRPDGLPVPVALLLDTVASHMRQGHLDDISGTLPRRFGQVADALAATTTAAKAVRA